MRPRERASCATPNVQSLPKGSGFRGCVRSEEGRVLVRADLSQIELRVPAVITGDENMLEVFRRGGDLHLNTAGSPGRARGKEGRSRAPEGDTGIRSASHA